MNLLKFSDIEKDTLDEIIQLHFNHWRQYTNSINLEDTKHKFQTIYTDNKKLPICYALFDKNKLLGFCVIKKENLTNYKEIYPWISDVMIVSSERNKGYGKKMINFIMNEIRKLGYEKVYVWTDQAPTFYEKLGFHFEKNVRKNNGEGTGLLYSKKIRRNN